MFRFREGSLIFLILLLKGIGGVDIFSGFDHVHSGDDTQRNTSLITRNGKFLFDWFSWLLYDYYDDSEEDDEKYLICKNCTVIVAEQPPSTTTQSKNMTETPGTM